MAVPVAEVEARSLAAADLPGVAARVAEAVRGLTGR
jgi:hypothetical protein